MRKFSYVCTSTLFIYPSTTRVIINGPFCSAGWGSADACGSAAAPGIRPPYLAYVKPADEPIPSHTFYCAS